MFCFRSSYASYCLVFVLKNGWFLLGLGVCLHRQIHLEQILIALDKLLGHVVSHVVWHLFNRGKLGECAVIDQKEESGLIEDSDGVLIVVVTGGSKDALAVEIIVKDVAVLAVADLVVEVLVNVVCVDTVVDAHLKRTRIGGANGAVGHCGADETGRSHYFFFFVCFFVCVSFERVSVFRFCGFGGELGWFLKWDENCCI